MLEAQGKDKYKELPGGGVEVEFIDDPKLVELFRKRARELQSSLLTLGARQTSKSASRFLKMLDGDNFTYPSLTLITREIESRLQDELEDVTLLALAERERDLFEPNKPLFGVDLEVKFPTQGAFELDEAARCIALGRHTAGVFHLMRVMEIGIRGISRCLGIPDPLKPSERSWGPILKSIRDGIDAKWPTVGARAHGNGAFFDSLYASLDAVKNPWRNATMHVEDKKTEMEAEHIFVAVKAFMMKLAARCDETGQPLA